MTLTELLTLADKAYEGIERDRRGAILHAWKTGDHRHGDPLAGLIANDLADGFDAKETTEEQFKHAKLVLQGVIEELQAVIDGLGQ